MPVTQKLKYVILNKLNQDLESIDVIPYKESVWLVDKKNKVWHFELKNSGTLWWNIPYYSHYIDIFNLNNLELESILIEWVEDTLHKKINSLDNNCESFMRLISNVTNYSINKTRSTNNKWYNKVEDIFDSIILNTSQLSSKITDKIWEQESI